MVNPSMGGKGCKKIQMNAYVISNIVFVLLLSERNLRDTVDFNIVTPGYLLHCKMTVKVTQSKVDQECQILVSKQQPWRIR